MITLDLSKAKLAEDLGSYKEKVAEIHDMILIYLIYQLYFLLIYDYTLYYQMFLNTRTD